MPRQINRKLRLIFAGVILIAITSFAALLLTGKAAERDAELDTTGESHLVEPRSPNGRLYGVDISVNIPPVPESSDIVWEVQLKNTTKFKRVVSVVLSAGFNADRHRLGTVPKIFEVNNKKINLHSGESETVVWTIPFSVYNQWGKSKEGHYQTITSIRVGKQPLEFTHKSAIQPPPLERRIRLGTAIGNISGVDVTVDIPHRVPFGSDIVWKVQLKNNATYDQTAHLVLEALGGTHEKTFVIDSAGAVDRKIELSAGKSDSIVLTIPPSDYAKYRHRIFEAEMTVSIGKQELYSGDEHEFFTTQLISKNPELALTADEPIAGGHLVNLRCDWTNPLPLTLNNVSAVFKGWDLLMDGKRRVDIKIGDVAPGCPISVDQDALVVRYIPFVVASVEIYSDLACAGAETKTGIFEDCNNNGYLDGFDIYQGLSRDCNGNGELDECEIRDHPPKDSNRNKILDSCEKADEIISQRHLSNIPRNRLPDKRDEDRNNNGRNDRDEIHAGWCWDNNGNYIPDECEARFEVKGQIFSEGNGLGGITVALLGVGEREAKRITDADGSYTFMLPNGDYTLMPVSPYHVFTPVYTSVTVRDNDLIVENFEAALLDSDGDGIPDKTDNCRLVANAEQADSDGDGVGNACDNCISVRNPVQADFNGNGVGDACEPTLPHREVSD